MTQTVRLTVAQAVVKFLAHQYTERDGIEQKARVSSLKPTVL